jgi:hypothetical protein
VLTVYCAQMHNLKSRIKRRRHARGTQELSSSSSTASVGADWEFVNFNPFVYGPKRPTSSDSCNVSLVRATQSHHEDYYEFPTSTKLHTSPSSVSSPSQLRNNEGRENHVHNRYQRHSLSSALDFLTPDQPPAHHSHLVPSPLTLSPSQTPAPVQNPLDSPSNSKFYLPTPPHAESSRRSSLTSVNSNLVGVLFPPQPSHGSPRPRSWDIDSGTGTMVVHPQPKHETSDRGENVMHSSGSDVQNEGLSYAASPSVPILPQHPSLPAPHTSQVTAEVTNMTKNGIIRYGKFYIKVGTSMNLI